MGVRYEACTFGMICESKLQHGQIPALRFAARVHDGVLFL